ncbi:MAG TPA: homoserine kinase [Actinomycetaceae bacterium]|nr:homoserine kinase [Actinomycetaceae bacterium]
MSRLTNDSVVVRVPATSANLGPGFDSMGLALEIVDEIRVRATAGPTQVTVEGHGSGEVPEGDDHLVVKAIRRGLDYVGAPQAGLVMHCHNAIPHGSGLGSSAAAVVAGLIIARGLVGDPTAMSDGEILALATEMEGHPDNAAPALLGGATVAWVGPEGPDAARVEVGPHLAPTVLTPPTPVLTRRARAVLPSEVPHADAAFNAGRAALLVLALQSREDLLLTATEDRLHQQQRMAVMPETLEVVAELRARGLPAVVSGAGPSVLALAGRDEPAMAVLQRHGWQVSYPPVALHGARVVSRDAAPTA